MADNGKEGQRARSAPPPDWYPEAWLRKQARKAALGVRPTHNLNPAATGTDFGGASSFPPDAGGGGAARVRRGRPAQGYGRSRPRPDQRSTDAEAEPKAQGGRTGGGTRGRKRSNPRPERAGGQRDSGGGPRTRRRTRGSGESRQRREYARPEPTASRGRQGPAFWARPSEGRENTGWFTDQVRGRGAPGLLEGAAGHFADAKGWGDPVERPQGQLPWAGPSWFTPKEQGREEPQGKLLWQGRPWTGTTQGQPPRPKGWFDPVERQQGQQRPRAKLPWEGPGWGGEARRGEPFIKDSELGRPGGRKDFILNSDLGVPGTRARLSSSQGRPLWASKEPVSRPWVLREPQARSSGASSYSSFLGERASFDQTTAGLIARTVGGAMGKLLGRMRRRQEVTAQDAVDYGQLIDAGAAATGLSREAFVLRVLAAQAVPEAAPAYTLLGELLGMTGVSEDTRNQARVLWQQAGASGGGSLHVPGGAPQLSTGQEERASAPAPGTPGTPPPPGDPPTAEATFDNSGDRDRLIHIIRENDQSALRLWRESHRGHSILSLDHEALRGLVITEKLLQLFDDPASIQSVDIVRVFDENRSDEEFLDFFVVVPSSVRVRDRFGEMHTINANAEAGDNGEMVARYHRLAESFIVNPAMVPLFSGRFHVSGSPEDADLVGDYVETLDVLRRHGIMRKVSEQLREFAQQQNFLYMVHWHDPDPEDGTMGIFQQLGNQRYVDLHPDSELRARFRERYSDVDLPLEWLAIYDLSQATFEQNVVDQPRDSGLATSTDVLGAEDAARDTLPEASLLPSGEPTQARAATSPPGVPERANREPLMEIPDVKERAFLIDRIIERNRKALEQWQREHPGEPILSLPQEALRAFIPRRVYELSRNPEAVYISVEPGQTDTVLNFFVVERFAEPVSADPMHRRYQPQFEEGIIDEYDFPFLHVSLRREGSGNNADIHVMNLTVHPEMRQIGIAREFYAVLKEFGQAQDFQYITGSTTTNRPNDTTPSNMEIYLHLGRQQYADLPEDSEVRQRLDRLYGGKGRNLEWLTYDDLYLAPSEELFRSVQDKLSELTEVQRRSSLVLNARADSVAARVRDTLFDYEEQRIRSEIDSLPSDAQIAAMLEVSQPSVNQIKNALIALGLIERNLRRDLTPNQRRVRSTFLALEGQRRRGEIDSLPSDAKIKIALDVPLTLVNKTGYALAAEGLIKRNPNRKVNPNVRNVRPTLLALEERRKRDANFGFPTDSEIATRLGVSRESVFRIKAKLADAGLIERTTQNPNAGKIRPTLLALEERRKRDRNFKFPSDGQIAIMVGISSKAVWEARHKLTDEGLLEPLPRRNIPTTEDIVNILLDLERQRRGHIIKSLPPDPEIAAELDVSHSYIVIVHSVLIVLGSLEQSSRRRINPFTEEVMNTLLNLEEQRRRGEIDSLPSVKEIARRLGKSSHAYVSIVKRVLTTLGLIERST